MSKVERLVNLVSLLLATRRPLTIEEIRAKIPGYEHGSDEAFRRMFERDKHELRELGFPLDLVPTDAWEVEEGYLIRGEDALIGDLGLTPDERAALEIAARAWTGDAAGPATALLKIAAAAGGGGTGNEPAPGDGWIVPRVDVSEPNLDPLMDAVRRRKHITFRYRSGATGDAEERAVDPYGLRYRSTWYVTGFDHAREAVRSFKVSRIEGTVVVAAGDAADFERPAGPLPALPHGPWEGAPHGEARIAFSPEASWWVERRTGGRRVAERDDGWAEIAIPVADAGRLAGWILGFADHAEVLEPAELRGEVRRRLEAICSPRLEI